MCREFFSADYLDPIYLIVTLLCISYQIQCQVTKCCSNGLAINITSEYYCDSIDDHNPNWNALNIAYSSIRNCSIIQNVFEQNETFIEIDGCLNRNLNDQFVAVDCFQNPFTGVHFMKKCCPNGQSYDYKERYCISHPDSTNHLNHFFGKVPIVFKYEVPNCTDDEVFVEYFSTIHDIEFNGTTITVNNDILRSNKFCIDHLSNTDLNDAPQIDEHFVMRSCRSRSICNQIPCMRRCCKVDEIIEAQPEGNKNCQSHPNKMNLIPTFYNVSLPLQNHQPQIHIEGTSAVLYTILEY